MGRRAVSALAVLLVATGLTACAAGVAESDDPQPVWATLHLHEGEVVVTDSDGARLGSSDHDELPDGAVVAVTGAEALVEVRWSDGAVTRLGDGSRFVVAGQDPTDPARGRLETGVSWNRVPEQAADYVVSAGERLVGEEGPFFVVDCRSGDCLTTGSGGEGDGSTTSYRWREGAEASTTSCTPYDTLFGDPWVRSNALLDEEQGFAPIDDAFADADPACASLTGAFDVTVTTLVQDCRGGIAECQRRPAVGTVVERSYVFGVDCSAGIPCTPVVTTQYVRTGSDEVLSETVPLSFDGRQYSWARPGSTTNCVWTFGDGSTAEVGASEWMSEWSVRPTDAELVDGSYVVTAASGEASTTVRIVERIDRGRFPGCELWEADADDRSSLDLTRAA